ncbi:hypothetical protein [Raoultibacter phocaeensis]|uniref:hypothetical protein n=1 Tax=Raoultibacter phocaeensis TaxID=2479841 RepID=UPI00111850E9|nr:hypothetical protein [Raoultibacter phocaeensis]
MERNDGIIDVTPVNQSNERASSQAPQPSAGHTDAAAKSSSASPDQHRSASPAPHGTAPKTENYYTFDGTSWHPGAQSGQPASGSGPAIPVDARVIGSTNTSDQPKSRLGGAARIAAGGVCTLAGIPMLILPGPGLLAIGGGVYLMASGAKRLFGK